MFQKHFFVQHCLYQLKIDYLEQGIDLDITPSKIIVKSVNHKASTDIGEVSSASALAEYYLNWDHFFKATPENISELMAKFWNHFHAFDQQDEALTTLGVTNTASWEEIQKAYRMLIAKAHPDKGGCADTFNTVKSAYDILKKVYAPSVAYGELVDQG